MSSGKSSAAGWNGERSKDLEFVPPQHSFEHSFERWGHWLHLVYMVLNIGALVVGAIFLKHSTAKDVITYVALLIYVLVIIVLFLIFMMRSTGKYAELATYSTRRYSKLARASGRRFTHLYANLHVPYVRKARYANAQEWIHSAMRSLSEANWYLSRCIAQPHLYHPAHLQESLRETLDSVVRAFEVITEVRNRACIKILGGEGDNRFAKTLCRDSKSHAEDRERDTTEGTVHKADKNTAYRQIIRAERPYFFCNDIPNYPELYDNTSRLVLGNKPLPYNSCIVFPIWVPAISDPSKDDTGTTILGFFAIDSKVVGTYDEQFDAELAGAIAEALSPVLYRWSVIHPIASEQQSMRSFVGVF